MQAEQLWGTDWPHPNLKSHMPDDGALVDYIPRITEDLDLAKNRLNTEINKIGRASCRERV